MRTGSGTFVWNLGEDDLLPLKLLKGQKVKSKVLGDVHKGRVDLRMKLTQRKAEPRAGKRNSQLL